VTDGSNLLYSTCPCSEGGTISRLSLKGGSPEVLMSALSPFGVRGDDLYGIETVDKDTLTGTMLTRAPKSGGQWQRVRALGGGAAVSKFQLVGDRYFYNQEPPHDDSYHPEGNWTTASVVTASLASNEPPVRLLERQTQHYWVEQVWVGTSGALFWTDGTKIYSWALDD